MNVMTLTEIVLIIGTVLSLVMVGYVHWGPGLMLFSLIGMLAYYSLKRGRITVDPPTVARTTIFDMMWPAVIRPRWVFVLEPIEKLVLIDRTPVVRSQESDKPEEKELIFRGVRCKAQDDEGIADPSKKKGAKESGGEVEVRIGITIVPDPNRTSDFIKAGRTPKVMQTLTNLLGQAVRHQAAGKTLEEYMLGKSWLAMDLITKLTNRQPTEKVEFQDGRPVPDLDESRHRKYQTRPRKLDEVLVDEDVEVFLDTALVDHPSDVHGLGILLPRLEVTQIEPQDPELKKDADRKAREKLQRAAERVDFATERELADEYVEWAKAKGEIVSRTQALEWVRTNRGRAKEIFLRAPAGTGSLLGFARDEMRGGSDDAHSD